MNLKLFPNDILRQRIEEFDFDNCDIDPIELEKKLIDFMFKHGGIGLAANQVGLKYRVFVMGHPHNPKLARAFFNPVVVKTTETFNDMEEGCLSFPNIYVKIKRPAKILAKWQNSQGQWEEGEFSGYDCKCFLHEYDHLEGIVFKDRVSNLKWALAIKKGKM